MYIIYNFVLYCTKRAVAEKAAARRAATKRVAAEGTIARRATA